MAKNDPMNGGGTGYFPAVYQSALAQTAKDYDSIQGQYQGLKSQAESEVNDNSNKVNFNPIAPQAQQYQPGSNYDYLREFTKNGGYSDADIGNLRERAVSPIRSIYSSAERNMNRQKNLSGGYSPNMGAVTSKLAREQSGIIGDQLTKANAGIAEMVQRGKLAGAQTLAPLEARETEMKNSINANNTNTANDFLKFNATAPLSYAQHNQSIDDNHFDNILKTIQGQQSMYGTTPALASTFGSQVLQAANTANNFAPVQRNTAPATSSYYPTSGMLNGGIRLGVGR